MSQVIVYANPDGSVAVVNPAPGFDVELLQSEVVPAGTPSWIVERGALPTGPQSTWALDGSGNVTIDLNRQAALIESQVPTIISDRQFFQQLASTPDPNSTTGATLISEDDALAAVCTGTIPPAMLPLISALPKAQQFAARMKLAGSTQFNISDVVTQEIAYAYGWSASQLAAFWRAASVL